MGERSGAGPKQPGHWLLLFGGIALLIDFGAFRHRIRRGAFRGRRFESDFRLARSSLVSSDWIFGRSAHRNWKRCRLRDTSLLWKIAAATIAVMISVNVASNLVSLIALAGGGRGLWLWYLPQYGTCCCPHVCFHSSGRQRSATVFNGVSATGFMPAESQPPPRWHALGLPLTAGAVAVSEPYST